MLSASGAETERSQRTEAEEEAAAGATVKFREGLEQKTKGKEKRRFDCSDTVDWFIFIFVVIYFYGF